MRRNMLAPVAFVLVIALTLLISYQSNAADQMEQQENQPILFQMLEHKISYLGDNALVGKLLSYLPTFDETYIQSKFALKTDAESNGLTIFYEPSEKNSGNSMAASEQMVTYADYLFQCIGNLGYIEYMYMKPHAGCCAEEPVRPCCDVKITIDGLDDAAPAPLIPKCCTEAVPAAPTDAPSEADTGSSCCNEDTVYQLLLRVDRK